MQPSILKRAYPFPLDRETIKRTKVDFSPAGTFFEKLPKSGELMGRILLELTFRDLENLLLVSKVFWPIIHHSQLSCKEHIDLNRMEVAFQTPEVPITTQFWGEFCTNMILESCSEEDSDFSVDGDEGAEIGYLEKEALKINRLLSLKLNEREFLLPNATTLKMNLTHDVTDSGRFSHLAGCFENNILSKIKKFQLSYIINEESDHSEYHQRLFDFTNKMVNLGVVKLLPTIDFSFTICKAAELFINLKDSLHVLKGKLLERKVECQFDFIQAFDFINSEDFGLDSVSSERVIEIYLCILEIFIRENEGQELTYSPKIIRQSEALLPDKKTFFFCAQEPFYIHEQAAFLFKQSCENREALSDFDTVFLHYKIKTPHLEKTIKELILALSEFKNLKKLILKPVISFYDDIIKNGVAQVAHEKMLQELNNFSKQRKILMQLDLVHLKENAIDKDQMLGKSDDPLKEKKGELATLLLNKAFDKLCKLQFLAN